MAEPVNILSDQDSDQDPALEEGPLKLECVVPINGVNWPVVIPVTISWDQFQSTIANKLGTNSEEIRLSYRFSSFTAAENAKVLCSQDHFQKMMMKANEFLTGKRKVCGGREFRVHLDPALNRSLPRSAEASASKKGTQKVINLHLSSLIVVVTS